MKVRATLTVTREWDIVPGEGVYARMSSLEECLSADQLTLAREPELLLEMNDIIMKVNIEVLEEES